MSYTLLIARRHPDRIVETFPIASYKKMSGFRTYFRGQRNCYDERFYFFLVKTDNYDRETGEYEYDQENPDATITWEVDYFTNIDEHSDGSTVFLFSDDELIEKTGRMDIYDALDELIDFLKRKIENFDLQDEEKIDNNLPTVSTIPAINTAVNAAAENTPTDN